MFLDIYVIQNVPSNNINRDDTGTPKTAIYGGYQRARVSSQAWKHAMRNAFPLMVDSSKLGLRTKHAVDLIMGEIVVHRPDLAGIAEKLASDVLKVTGVKVEGSKRAGSEKGTQVTQYLIFIARSEISKLASIAIKAHDAGEDLSKPSNEVKKEVSHAFHGVQALDVALFGRMLADAPDLNTDASAQVAHAISVNKVTQEYDYFSAVDDCSAEDNAGAAMLNAAGFNSSTLYRYATVSLTSLYEQLDDVEATVEGVRVFIKTFVESMPTGKQNSFANRTLPDAVVIVLRDSQPINCVSAFEKPVTPSEESSISHQAEDLLAKRLIEIDDAYGENPVKTWWMAVDGGSEYLAKLEGQVTFPQMLDEVAESVRGAISEGE